MKDLQKIEIKGVLTPLQVRIINLFRDDNTISLAKICRVLNLDWKQAFKITKRLMDKDILKRVKRGTYRLTKIGKDHIKIIDLFQLSSRNFYKFSGMIDVDTFLNGTDGASIVSALLSDGSVCGNQIRFLTTDKSLNEYVWNKLEKVFNKKIDRKYGCVRGRLEAEFLKLFTTYKTTPFRENKNTVSWPSVKIPEFIKEGNLDQKNEFLRVYASCDGSVSIDLFWNKRTQLYSLQAFVTITCKNPKLMEQLFDLLKKQGFNPTITRGYRIVLTGEDIIKFKYVGFVEGCKPVHGKYWRNIEKNRLLDLAISIVKLGPDIIPPHLRINKSKRNEIIEYLKKLLGRKENDLLSLRNLHKLLRNLSKNEVTILKLLKISDLSLDEIRNKVRWKIKNVSSLLTRMKKDKLIDNDFRKSWKITEFGKDILRETIKFRKNV